MIAVPAPRPMADASRSVLRFLVFGLALCTGAMRAANSIEWLALNTPATAIGGRTIGFTATVRNTGDETWGWNHYLELKAMADGAHLNYPSVDGLDPGDTRTVTFYLDLPASGGTFAYGFTGMEHNVEYFGATQTRSIVVSPAPVYTGVTLSSTTLNPQALPTIATDDAMPPHYKLRAKVIDGSPYGFHAATAWYNGGQPLNVAPPAGDYAVTALYWLKYDSYLGQLLPPPDGIGPERRVAITVLGNVRLTSYHFHVTQPPLIYTGQGFTGPYRLFATFQNASGTWETTSANGNNLTPLTAVPPAGTYQVSLYWKKYDGSGAVLETGPVLTLPVTTTITSGAIDVLTTGGEITWLDERDEDGNNPVFYLSTGEHTIDVTLAGTLHVAVSALFDIMTELRDGNGNTVATGGFTLTTPVTPGSYVVRVAGGSAGTYQISGHVTPLIAPPVVTSGTTATASAGVAYTAANPLYTITATGEGVIAYSAGNLPAGLTVAAATGKITGTLTAAGTFPLIWVEAANAAGSNGKFITITVLPPAPHAYAAEQITASRFLASWSAVTGATGYRLDVSANAAFTSLILSNYSPVYVFNGQTSIATSQTVTGLAPNTDYWYRVRAVTGAGTSANSSVISVRTAVATVDAASIWFDKPLDVRDPVTGDWTKVYDGLKDEIIPAGGSHGLTYYVLDYRYTGGTITFYDNDFPTNDWWYPRNVGFDFNGDGTSDFERPAFTPFWQSGITFSYTGEIYQRIGVEFDPELGYDYEICYSTNDIINPSSLGVVNGGGRMTAENANRQIFALFHEFTVAALNRGSLYLVRYAKPVASTLLTIPGIGPATVGIRTTGSVPSTGPISIGGATIDIGLAGGTIVLPGGGTITVGSGGTVSVSGFPGVPSGPVTGNISLGGLGSIQVSSAGTATITVGSGVPVLGGAVITGTAGGGGSIAFPNGVGVSVSNTGKLGITLPPGTNQTLVQIIDIATKVLSVANGASISVRDLLGNVIPLPTSGLLGALDVAITSKGRFEVGVKLGNDSWFWFDVYTFAMPQLAVDANRDGVINFNATDATSASAPFRFWLNDDIDRRHTVDNTDSEEDDIGGAEASGRQPDWQSNYIQSKRDLEDFARIVVSAGGLSEALKNGNLYLGLKWSSATGTPAIKLYKHVEADGGLNYLADDATAGQQINTAFCIADIRDTATQPQNATRVLVEGADVFVLPTSLFSGLSEAQPKIFLLFEGCKPGQGQLQLVLLTRNGTNYSEVGVGPGVWMDLKKIGDMYEHWSVGQGPDPRGGGNPDAVAARIAALSGSGTAFQYDAGTPSPEERKYLLYVHGWNMERWEKERFAETAYKRLYWQGYKGRFGLFSWPTTNRFEGNLANALFDRTNYNRGEWAAWKSAAPLRTLLQTLHGPGAYGNQVYVVAHSMGNVVVGEALRLGSQHGSGQLVNTYVASQAAIPVHVYDGSSTNLLDATGPLGISASTIGQFPQTPNTVYPDWLAGNGAAAGTRINFYNVNDFALWRDAWQLNQYLKPNLKDAPDQLWNYQFEDGLGAPPNLHDSFIRFERFDDLGNPVGIQEMQLGTQASIGDRYEIMSFAAESRSKALGGTPGNARLERSVDLQGSAVWPVDFENPLRPHSSHKWHSAEFRSTIMRQKGYWKALLDERGFNLGTTP